MFVLVVIFCLSLLELKGSETTAAVAQSVSFARTYPIEQAVQDTKINLSKFCWKSSESEPCTVTGELAEPIWNRICEKAFGCSPEAQGVVHTNYLNFILRSLLMSPCRDKRLQDHLMWIHRNVEAKEEPSIGNFTQGIDWGFPTTKHIFEHVYRKDSLHILLMMKAHTQPHTQDLLPFTPDESMMVYLACVFGKISPPNRQNMTSDFLLRAVKGNISAATVDLAALVVSQRAKHDENKIPITQDNYKATIARLFRKATAEGHTYADALLADLLDDHPELATPQESTNLLQTMANYYTHGMLAGFHTSFNNYHLFVEQWPVFTDEYNRPVQNRNVFLARILRQSVRVGDPNGWNSLGIMIAQGLAHMDEYGQTFPEDQRCEVAMRMFRKAIEKDNTMGWYNYAYFVKNGLFKKDEKGQDIKPEDQFKVAGRLLQNSASQGDKKSLNLLALLVYGDKFRESEQKSKKGRYLTINPTERAKEAIRMLELADYPDARLNLAGIKVEEAEPENMEEKKKEALYAEICGKIENLPPSPEKAFILTRAALRLQQSDFSRRVNQAMDAGSLDAFMLRLANETRSRDVTSPAKVDHAEVAVDAADDDSILDFKDEESDEEVSAHAAPLAAALPVMKLTETEQAARIAHKQRVTFNLEATFRKVTQKRDLLNKSMQEIKLTWSPNARAQLEQLAPSQRKHRLPLLIEALKEANYSRTLIRDCKHEKTAEGHTILYGNLSALDRMECTRTVVNGKVVAIHVLGLKGHHTSPTGVKRKGK